MTRICERCEFAFQATEFVVLGTAIGGQRRFCDRCMDLRRREREEAERSEAERERRRIREDREARICELLRACGANPWEHGRSTLDNFDASDGAAPVESAREFVAAVLSAGEWDPVRGLYLYGPTGTGKTHLAVGILRALLLEPSIDPSTLIFDHAARLVMEIQDSYSTRRSVEEIMDRRANAAVWVLDDLGTEQASEDAVRKLTVLFTDRGKRPTVVTSNLEPEALIDRNPELARIVSRLGPDYFDLVPVDGRDRRFG